MVRSFLILAFALFTFSATAVVDRSYWCTSTGLTLVYAKHQVWGQDMDTLTEAIADSIANCRADLSQCAVEECFERRGYDSYPVPVEVK